MRIAIEGCLHGEFDQLYTYLLSLPYSIDLVIICGDVQTLRNNNDLEYINVPKKYKHLGIFHQFYSGMRRIPIPTIMIGGNHEASNYLWELSLGGWICPNLYYLGKCGLIQFGGLRIGGWSGIYNNRYYHRESFERMPFTKETRTSVYYLRHFEFQMLSLLSSFGEITGSGTKDSSARDSTNCTNSDSSNSTSASTSSDITLFLSHEWPAQIYNHGNLPALLKTKPYFKSEIESNTLGNQPSFELLKQLKPKYWMSAHFHVKYKAEYDGVLFVGLDKLDRLHDAVEILEFNTTHPLQFEYDPFWLSIHKSCLPFQKQNQLPSNIKQLLSENYQWIINNIKDFRIPENFQPTAYQQKEIYDQNVPFEEGFTNPQTEDYCKMLGIENYYTVDEVVKSDCKKVKRNPEEIDL